MESCQLADLKYAIFSSTGGKTEEQERSKVQKMTLRDERT